MDESKDIKENLNMYHYSVKFVRAVDGDTVDLDVDLGFHIIVRDRFRLYGINTPERGKPGYKEATSFVTNWFSGQTIPNSAYIQSEKPLQDKYGRYLVKIYPTSDFIAPTLNDLLIQNNFAVVYFP